MPQHLIIFAKSPLAGYAKTRLGNAIGPEASAGVYARLLYSYLHSILCADLPEMTIELSLAAVKDVPYFEHAFPELDVRPQIRSDLGERMARAFARAFDAGADSVVLTGSDIPGLRAPIIREAFHELSKVTLLKGPRGVIGPATDGGYYLIGLTQPCPSLFREIRWSTERVLEQTRKVAKTCGISLETLPELADIDTGADYERWLTTLQRRYRNGEACLDYGSDRN
jgi:rSAM/selenodomain-associated transferase 1